ncbi:MAG: hypothetical protein KZQ65_05705, partial [Candidatus Thiodiazotropha sp. (ex Gloverina cf. vestifex)]|nr:hypothetical protein [Candidatus Thiodiazotropha sp. (ex Gloverina cf. vestifex)]
MHVKNRRSLLFIFLCSTLLLGINEASAFTSMGRQIETFCSDNGHTLLPAYANDTCDAACHDNNQGQSAYDSGNLEFFCPPVIVQEPTCTDADNDGYYTEGNECGTPVDFNDNSTVAYQACRYLVKDFGTSESPKSTRQRDSRYAPT